MGEEEGQGLTDLEASFAELARKLDAADEQVGLSISIVEVHTLSSISR